MLALAKYQGIYSKGGIMKYSKDDLVKRYSNDKREFMYRGKNTTFNDPAYSEEERRNLAVTMAVHDGLGFSIEDDEDDNIEATVKQKSNIFRRVLSLDDSVEHLCKVGAIAAGVCLVLLAISLGLQGLDFVF